MVAGLAGIRLTSPEPGALVRRWAAALGVEADGPVLALPDGSRVEVAEGPDERLAGIDLVAAPGVAPRDAVVAGTVFRLVGRR